MIPAIIALVSSSLFLAIFAMISRMVSWFCTASSKLLLVNTYRSHTSAAITDATLFSLVSKAISTKSDSG